MTGDGQSGRGFPRWHIFAPRISPLGFIFTGVEASAALRRDVEFENDSLQFMTYLETSRSMIDDIGLLFNMLEFLLMAVEKRV